jgi:hypothetical protein
MATPESTPPLPPTPDPYGPGLIRLTPHTCGQWRKRRNGRDYYFGPRHDPARAIAEYLRRWPLILADDPHHSQVVSPARTLGQALALYLDDSKRRVAAGERSHTHHRDLAQICAGVCVELGGGSRPERLRPAHWSRGIDAAWGHLSPVVRHIRITKLRSVLRWLERNHNIRFNTGDALRPVPARVRRRHLRLAGPGLLTPGQIRRLIKVCRAREGTDRETMEACLWMAINGGMRQSDIAALTPAAFRPARTDCHDHGWIDEPRAKTESIRRFPLWPETRAALDRALSRRVSRNRLLVTTAGTPLMGVNDDRLGRRFAALRAAAWPDESSRWRACTLGQFRATHITVAATAPVSRVELARLVRMVMVGHVISGVHETYIRSLPDEPFLETSSHVRRWLGLG